jgi:hypothetical protein
MQSVADTGLLSDEANMQYAIFSASDCRRSLLVCLLPARLLVK